MSIDPISSAANPLVKQIRGLADRRTRERVGLTVVEGLQSILQADEAGWGFDTLVTSPDLRAAAARDFVARQSLAGTRVVQFTAELMARVSDRDRPSGLLAILRVASLDLAALPRPASTQTWVALERISNPGNLGTIVRTAEASGAAGVVLVGHTADPWDPAAIKASMGAAFNVPIARAADLVELRAWIDQVDATLVTTAGRAPASLWETRFPERVVVLLGAEGPGLDDETLAAGDLAVSIPMTGHAESLNVASAAAVLLYEVWRQRQADPQDRSTRD